MTYCVVPREVSPELHQLVRSCYGGDGAVPVIVERRRGERRCGARRQSNGSTPKAAGRRRIRNEDGRRVADRRAVVVPVEPAQIPRRLRRFADQLTFFERIESSGDYAIEIDSSRLAITFQSGDMGAMAKLYMRYFDEVYAYTRLALRDTYEAEDVTQQVFTNACQALSSYEIRPRAPFKSWLLRIARNAVVDALRQQRRVQVEDPEVIGVRCDAEMRDGVEQTLSWLNDSEVALFVERLPDAQREALVLRFILDLPVDQIAQVMGKTPKAVRRLQERALTTLQERLVAAGHRPVRQRARVPLLVRVRPLPVIAARRFALGWAGALPGGLRTQL